LTTRQLYSQISCNLSKPDGNTSSLQLGRINAGLQFQSCGEYPWIANGYFAKADRYLPLSILPSGTENCSSHDCNAVVWVWGSFKLIMIVLIIVFQIIITARDALKNISEDYFVHCNLWSRRRRYSVRSSFGFPARSDHCHRLALGTAVFNPFFYGKLLVLKWDGIIHYGCWMR
jgi:hypothetical protein